MLPDRARRHSPFARFAPAAAGLALAAGALWLCLHHGRRGFLPLDQSIVFDGGWRLLSGQVPFVDFDTPAALVPAAMQAWFFRAFGVTMFAYALHAAVVNAAFALVAVWLMRQLDAGWLASFLVGAGSAIVFYPPMGLPYADQHSFFFSLVAIALAAVTVTGGRGATFAAVLTPAVAWLAFFSKPIPAVFLAAPAAAVSMVMLAAARRFAFATLAVVAPVAVGVASAFAVGAPLERIWYYTVTLPRSGALDRFDAIGRAARVIEDLPNTVAVVTPFLSVVVALAVIVAVGVRARGGRQLRETRRPVVLAVMTIVLAAATMAFAMLTNKNAANALALMFVMLGTSWLAADSALTEFVALTRTRSRAMALLAVVSIATGARDAWRFNHDVNALRAVNLPVQPGEYETQPGGRLSYLRLRVPLIGRYQDINAYLSQQPFNFFLIGDSSLLYGIHRRPSISPALWFHPGLTMPAAPGAAFDAFEATLLERIDRYNVKLVLVEPGGTWMRVSLEKFPRLLARVAGCPETQIGDWVVRHLCR